MPDADSDQIVALSQSDHQRLLGELQQERTSTPERTVYHYSGDVALYQILESGNLWLSDYTTLNDPSELSYGVQIGLTVLQQELVARGNPPNSVRFVAGVQSVLNRGLHSILRAYVLSMSVASDELTQWRSYADGATGYCLGFDSQPLDQAFRSFCAAHDHMGWGSFEMLYDPSMLRVQMNAHANIALDAVALLTNPTAEQLQHLAVILTYSMIYTALYFKHEAFASEREYRLMLVTAASEPPGTLLKRARRQVLVDYLTLDWKTSFVSALQSIRIGPAADVRRASAFIAETTALHLPGRQVAVDQSTIPFRG